MTITTPQAFLDAVATRRSVYTIDDKRSPLPQADIESIVKKALAICPSPWNIGPLYKKLWDEIIVSAMHNTLPSDAVPGVEARIKGFTAGLGAVLFFENQDTLDALGQRQPMVASLTAPWSDVASGMVQHTVWTALWLGDLGCSLQHYDWSSDVVEDVRKEFDIPHSWSLKAQLVFGNKYQEPGERFFKPAQTIEERLKVVA